MEDEHQSTLKKKIQILFQLGKWPDVIKLCASYNEQYGKDMEIDMLRFKSERHLGIASPAPGEKQEADKAGAKKEERPLAAIVDAAAKGAAQPAAEEPQGEPQAVKEEWPFAAAMDKTEGAAQPAAEEPQGTGEEALDFESLAPKEITIGDPFAEDELVITDPFAEDGPGFSLAPEQPPVNVSGGAVPEATIVATPALEMEGPADSPPADEEKEFDFSKYGGIAIDAEPELVPSRPQAQHPGPVFRDREEEKPEGHPHSGAGRVDIIEEPKEEMAPPAPAPVPEPEERPRKPDLLFAEALAKEAPKRKISFNFKHALLAILVLAAALALWLTLSGKLNLTGGQEEPPASQPIARPAAESRPELVKKEVSPAVAEAPEVSEQDRTFDEKFRQAEELEGKGDLLKAWAVLLEAKKIKMTEPLRLLEEQLANKIRAAEEKTKLETQVAKSQIQLESDAFAKAEAANTIPAWQEFVKKYPGGENALRAGRSIAQLEKKVQEDSQQAMLLRIRQSQRVRPRADSQGMNQGDITSMLRQLGKPPTQFEVHEHGGAKVLLDFASGLMWTLWNKPMVYSKAKWWANRVTAGYSGWRLPTAEEALSLMQMDRGQYAGLPDFAVWTGDTVSDQPRMVWVLRIPDGQFLPKDYDQSYYVWAVRKAGK